MFLVERSVYFDRWLTKLKDRLAKARILVRLKKVETGNLGEYRSVGERVSELKIDYAAQVTEFILPEKAIRLSGCCVEETKHRSNGI